MTNLTKSHDVWAISCVEDFNRAAWYFLDPTRVRIICLIEHFKSVCIADLLQIITDTPQQKLHRHLNYLKSEGCAIGERYHQTVFYRFDHLSKEFRYMLTYASELTEVKQDIEAYEKLLKNGDLIASEYGNH